MLKPSTEILQELLDYLGIKANRLSVEIGDNSNSRIYYVRNGRSKISPKLAKAITERYKEINYDYLITGKGELVRKGVLVNSSGNVFVEKNDGSFNVTTRLIPFDAYSSYLETLDDANIIYDWEEVTFSVDRYGRGHYEAFTTKNDSMNGGGINDTPSGALVLGRELGRQHWLDGFNPTTYGWIILAKQNIFHKDIIGLDKEKGTILCHSRNTSPEFSDFELELNDVYQIFKVIKRTF
ncbi:conserved hypothetical protein [Tenacibaculum maritimum]|uniref:hypothetical protein n=1 Tax=Tenacibaculum TaxID=104267 RepID=UPI0012E63CE2|nr:hypothetical protein [Tenacibaculum maritimum]CAA0177530.1 conserved hypothetical protein [Tenacibaculum maritimum]